MTSTDLKPGDIVQHAERGLNGLAVHGDGEETRVLHLTSLGIVTTTSDLDGWERVEAIRSGHIQVRVDDLADGIVKSWGEYAEDGGDPPEWKLCARAVKAIRAQRDQATSQDAPEQLDDEGPHSRSCAVRNHTHGFSCAHDCPTCNPGTVGAQNPASTTVTLPCPDCGEAVTDTATVGIEDEGGYYLTFANSETHTCPPAQPDEPTEFGARVTVTLPDGTREKWCRLGKHHSAPWLGETYDVPGEEWGLLCQRGTVTIGWSVEHD